MKFLNIQWTTYWNCCSLFTTLIKYQWCFDHCWFPQWGKRGPDKFDEMREMRLQLNVCFFVVVDKKSFVDTSEKYTSAPKPWFSPITQVGESGWFHMFHQFPTSPPCFCCSQLLPFPLLGWWSRRSRSFPWRRFCRCCRHELVPKQHHGITANDADPVSIHFGETWRKRHTWAELLNNNALLNAGSQ